MAKKPPQLADEEKFGPAGLRWLYEMEAINSPTLLNNLYGNLYSFPGVKDCEILIDRYQRKMLIYVKFSWFLRRFRRAERVDLVNSMLDQLQELLPSFEFRIIEDRKLFEKALRRMERALFGGKDETGPKPSSVPAAPDGDTSNSADSDSDPRSEKRDESSTTTTTESSKTSAQEPSEPDPTKSSGSNS